MVNQDFQIGDIYVKHTMLYDRCSLITKITKGYLWYKWCDMNGVFSEYEKERRCNKNEAFRELGAKVTILYRKKKQAEADAVEFARKKAAICQKIIGIVSNPNLTISDSQLAELENIINSTNAANENTN